VYILSTSIIALRVSLSEELKIRVLRSNHNGWTAFIRLAPFQPDLAT
jgi:hypothetical protein